MKRTSSMKDYSPTIESNELFLYASNTSSLYYNMIVPTITSLRKKTAKGVYDIEKAIDSYYYIACEASKMYNKEFGYSFSVSDRFRAAVELEKYYRQDNVFYELELA